jgi:GNAT superfamily N-acetyltransferase
MNGIKIRNACLDDAAATARLVTQLGYATTDLEMKERLGGILPEPNYMTFVAEHEAEVVGMLGVGVFRYYERNGVYGRLLTLVVDEKRQRRGIGAALVAAGESWLRERNAKAVIVNSGKHRAEAHRFYENLGYLETGVRFVKGLS